MEDVEQVTTLAKGIADYGTLTIIGAVFIMLVLALFQWFKSIVNQIIEDNRSAMQDLLKETRLQNDLLNDLSDGLRAETQMRIRNLSGFAFDLAVLQVCQLIKRVRKENHIADHEATGVKIRSLLGNIHEDRKSRFDPFLFRGKNLSSFCRDEWIEMVAIVVEGEIYNSSGEDDARAHTNVKMVYEKIKLDFYHNLKD